MKTASLATASLILVVLFLDVSCSRKAVHGRALRVQELSNLRPAADDPALRGEGFDPSAPTPPTPPEFVEKGAFFSKVHWSPAAEFDLKPGESHSITVALPKPATVFARASWRRGAGPISILMTKDGTTVASGTTFPVPPDRGTALAYGSVKKAGSASVLVRNESAVPVKVEVVVGALAGGQQ
jgi:hypothetical protein